MIGVGSDDLGFALKVMVRDYMTDRGEAVHDFGAFTPQPVDYPDTAVRVAEAVRLGLVERAVLVCGTGLRIAIAANKVPGVFAAPVSTVELAIAARRSNNAQIITLGARVVTPDEACAIVEAWLNTEFQGGGSARKIAKIGAIEERYRTARPRGLPTESGEVYGLSAARG